VSSRLRQQEIEVNRTALRRIAAPGVAALALGLAVSACGAGNESNGSTSDSKLSGTLNGAGSSAQAAAEQAWQAAFQGANPDVTVNYDPVGSGGGREQFLAGGVAFAGSDAALEDAELESSKKVCNGQTAFDVPVYVSPIAVVYKVDGVDKLNLSAETIAGIFDGKIKKWNDAAIKADNPDAKLPDATIQPVHRSDDSGTTKNFTDYLNKASNGAWSYDADGVWPNKVGEAAPQNSGVAAAVTGGTNTIGYVDESQAGDLSIASIKVGSEYVAPTAEAAAKLIEVSKTVEGRPEGDFALELDRTTTEAGTYPIALLSYAIACPTYSDKGAAELVKSYLTYVISAQGQADAQKTAGSAPLPASLVEEATKQIANISAS
jgi:phosphate transport system substrate-binding protein